jgi:hypothetical protein
LLRSGDTARANDALDDGGNGNIVLWFITT